MKDDPRKKSLRDPLKKVVEEKQEIKTPIPQAPSESPENPSKGGISDNFKEALSFIGPRLGALLIGGTEGMETTDKLLSSYDKAQLEKAKLSQPEKMNWQQTSYQTKEGQPVFLAGNQLVDSKGNSIEESQIVHGAAVGAERSDKLKQARSKQDLKKNTLKEFRKVKKDLDERTLTVDKAMGIINSKAKLTLPYAARALVLASGDKRISDADVQQFKGNMSLVNKARQAVARWKDGDTSTEADREAFREMFRILKDRDEDALQKYARGISAESGALREDTSPEDLWKIVSAGNPQWGKYEQEEEKQPQGRRSSADSEYDTDTLSIMDKYR